MPISEVYNEDCMTGMARYPDKFFDLAICDPPYGIGASEMQMGLGKKKWNKGKQWDTAAPSQEYFNSLFRVSKNQIIWGGNYFKLPINRGWIFWDKDVQPDLSFSSGELAWTSFDIILKKANINYSGFRGREDDKIHPTQKPIQLYKWCFLTYAQKGDKIIDTHMGSQSSRIAAFNMGFDFWGWEIDKEYFDAGNKRFAEQTAQIKLF